MKNKRPTIADLRAMKGRRQILTLHVENSAEAAAASAAGIEMFTFEVDERFASVRAAAPGVFIQAGYAQGQMACEKSAVKKGFAALEAGVDSIYFAGSLRIVEAMAREGIPVTGHVGYVPRWHTWTNARAIGKTPDEAAATYKAVKDLENAGACMVEMEIIPVEVADFITRNTTLITEGMGCGAVCDTQYLFSCDVLGTNREHYPRHAVKYADLAGEEDRLQDIRIDAFRRFSGDVASGKYPLRTHEIHVKDDARDQVLEALEKAHVSALR